MKVQKLAVNAILAISILSGTALTITAPAQAYPKIPKGAGKIFKPIYRIGSDYLKGRRQRNQQNNRQTQVNQNPTYRVCVDPRTGYRFYCR